MTVSEQPSWQFSLRTAWARNLETPLRQFLRTETGSAAVLLAATIAALVWVNIGTRVVRVVLGHHGCRSASAQRGPVRRTCTAG